MLNRLESDIATGTEINELELIYLPFFKSEKMKPTELLRKAINIANRLETKNVSKDKLFALMLRHVMQITSKDLLPLHRIYTVSQASLLRKWNVLP